MALDMTTFDAALKELYPSGTIKNLEYQKHPLLAMIPKDTNFYGDTYVQPVVYGSPQGRSATFSDAVDNKGNSSLTKFSVTHVRDYSLATIDGLTVRTSQSDKGAFLRAAKFEVDQALHTANRSLARSLFRNGGGALGRVTTGGTGTSITLTDVQDVTNFEVGMEVEFSTADGTSGSLKAGTVTVTAINRSTGVLTVDAMSAIASGSGTADNDYIFQEGDFGNMLSGLDAWVPASVTDSFFGVTRTTDATRLGGVRYTGTSLTIEEALIEGMTLLGREGGSPDVCFLSYKQYGRLLKALGSKVQYDSHAVGEISFKGIELHGPTGSVKIFPDQNCQPDIAWLLQMDTWKLATCGPAPGILDFDGNKFLREASSDAYEVRTGYYGNVVCKAPGWNCRVTLAA